MYYRTQIIHSPIPLTSNVGAKHFSPVLKAAYFQLKVRKLFQENPSAFGVPVKYIFESKRGATNTGEKCFAPTH